MDQQEILGVVAQLALAIVGFSGIVAVLGQRAAGSWTASDMGRMGVMLTAAFRTLFASLLPLVFLHFQLPDRLVWAWSSGIIGTVALVLLIAMIRIAPSVTADVHHNPNFQRFAFSLSFIGVAVNLLNAADVVFHRSFGAYLFALLISFGVSCMYFVRLIQTAMGRNALEEAEK